MLPEYKKLFVKYLNSLKEEISAYRNESDIWKVTGTISNTPGNLCLHLCGNLQHYFGALIGKSGYVRKRDQEFSRKNVSRAELLNEIGRAIQAVSMVFDKIDEHALTVTFADKTFGENATNGDAILHCAIHFGYHLGQINYQRRILGL
jgi:hypothetical protein